MVLQLMRRHFFPLRSHALVAWTVETYVPSWQQGLIGNNVPHLFWKLRVSIRVTRLGEFSPNGRLSTLASFLKITEVAHIFGGYFYPR
jgi:hypothetical protein